MISGGEVDAGRWCAAACVSKWEPPCLGRFFGLVLQMRRENQLHPLLKRKQTVCTGRPLNTQHMRVLHLETSVVQRQAFLYSVPPVSPPSLLIPPRPPDRFELFRKYNLSDNAGVRKGHELYGSANNRMLPLESDAEDADVRKCSVSNAFPGTSDSRFKAYRVCSSLAPFLSPASPLNCMHRKSPRSLEDSRALSQMHTGHMHTVRAAKTYTSGTWRASFSLSLAPIVYPSPFPALSNFLPLRRPLHPTSHNRG